MKLFANIFTLVAVGLLVGCTESNVRQASEEFNNLPKAVQEATRDQMPNAEVASVERQERNGINVYTIRFRNENRHPPLEVAQDGTIIKFERSIGQGGSFEVEGDEVERAKGRVGSELSALPLAVQRAVRANTPRAEVVRVLREEEEGQRVYIIEFAGHERNPRLKVTDDGSVLRE